MVEGLVKRAVKGLLSEPIVRRCARSSMAVFWRCLIAVLATGNTPSAQMSHATLWTFDNPERRMAPSSGTATLAYFDPDGTGWGPAKTTFGTASSFGLPAMTGGDPTVMRLPARTARQGLRLSHTAPPNGPYGESHSLVSNYTLI